MKMLLKLIYYYLEIKRKKYPQSSSDEMEDSSASTLINLRILISSKFFKR